MRKISWRKTSCCYPFWKHSYSAHANRNALFSVLVAVAVSRFHQLQFSSPLCNQQPPAPRQTPSHRGYQSRALWTVRISDFVCVQYALPMQSQIWSLSTAEEYKLWTATSCYIALYVQLSSPAPRCQIFPVCFSPNVRDQGFTVTQLYGHNCEDARYLGVGAGRGGGDVWCLFDGYQCSRKTCSLHRQETRLPDYLHWHARRPYFSYCHESSKSQFFCFVLFGRAWTGLVMA
jgi:hypothetical protein